MNELTEASIALMAKPNASDWFKELLLTIHSIIRSSVPLMQTAYNKCDSLVESELKTRLMKYYGEHIKEEVNHDEWLLDDLESIGVSREKSLSRKPSQVVAELVGSQYYWIYHWHPVCLLGYITVFEAYPPRKNILDQIQKVTGYPEAAFRTLLEHSDLDSVHGDDLLRLLDYLPLSAEHEQWVTLNALYTASKLSQIENELSEMY